MNPPTKHFQAIDLICLYTADVQPPEKWTRVINGQKITPHLIHRTLKKCKERGVDMMFVAERLGVGAQAICRYIDSECTVPLEIAERFYALFSSGEKLPLAPPPPDPWGDLPQFFGDSWKTKPIRFRSPDFDSVALGKLFAAEREKRGWTWYDVGQILGAASGSIKRVEEGKVMWITSSQSLLIRLGDLYGIDIRRYENKPRINYKLFQKRLTEVKQTRGLSQQQMVDGTSVSRFLMSSYLNLKLPRREPVYLEDEMVELMAFLDIDPTEVILTDETKEDEMTEPQTVRTLMTFDVKKFTHDLLAARKELKYSYRYLTKLTGMSDTKIWSMENADRRASFPIEAVLNLCSVLGLSLEDYITTKEAPRR